MLVNILTVVHLVAAIGIVVLVLLQQGKGADMGAAFGGGGSQTLFGARGSANFLTRLTTLLATVFLVTSLSLAFIYQQYRTSESVTDQIQAPVKVESTEPDIPSVPQDSAPTPTTSDGATDNSDIPVAPGNQ